MKTPFEQENGNGKFNTNFHYIKVGCKKHPQNVDIWLWNQLESPRVAVYEINTVLFVPGGKPS